MKGSDLFWLILASAPVGKAAASASSSSSRLGFVAPPLAQHKARHHECSPLRAEGRGKGRGKKKTGGKGKGRKGGNPNWEEEEMIKATQTYSKMEARKEAKKGRKRERGERNSQQDAAPRMMDNPFKAVSKVNPLIDPKKNVQKKRFNPIDVKSIEFIGSFVDDESKWPSTTLPEIAFLGRSNVGKSSMLNTLFAEKAAKVSKTPGRTRQINLFKALNDKGKEICWFADLPGYGYAKMGKSNQRVIEVFLDKYLKNRPNLKLLILLVDSRREPLEVDEDIISFVQDSTEDGECNYKLLVAATKVDKLSSMENTVNIPRIREAFHLPGDMPVPFSSVNGKGRSDVWGFIRDACRL